MVVAIVGTLGPATWAAAFKTTTALRAELSDLHAAAREYRGVFAVPIRRIGRRWPGR